MSDLVGHPEDRFSRVAAQIEMGPRRVKSLILKNLEYFLFVVYKLSFITSNSATNEPHREKKGLLQRFSIVQYYKLLFLTSIVFNLTTIANRLPLSLLYQGTFIGRVLVLTHGGSKLTLAFISQAFSGTNTVSLKMVDRQHIVKA